MKKYFLILLAAMFTNTLIAQTPAISTKYTDAEIDELILRFNRSRNWDVRTVDGALAQRFRADFPDARNVEWETNNEVFEVEFYIGHSEFDAYYDKDGNLLMYVQDLSTRDLPEVIRNAAQARLPGYRFDDIDKVVKGTRTYFVIEMERGDLEYQLVISNDGTILSERRD